MTDVALIKSKDRKFILEYLKQYPKDECGFLEPNGFAVTSKKGKMFRVDEYTETVDAFLDRLERSKKAGRNLFYEEWEPFEYDPELLY